MEHLPLVQGQQDAQQSAAELRAQIRQQVRDQIEAARAQARAAQEQARAAQEAAQQGAPAPPGVVMVPPLGPDMIPPQVVDISIAFFVMIAVIIVGLPLARAFGRRLDRKAVPPALDPGIVSQLQRIENTVESMSIEIERISEAQRYMARLQTERNNEHASLPPRQATPQ
jgi:hypothetical protein